MRLRRSRALEICPLPPAFFDAAASSYGRSGQLWKPNVIGKGARRRGVDLEYSLFERRVAKNVDSVTVPEQRHQQSSRH